MKLALYSEDGATQVVITPQTKWEQDILDKLPEDGDYRVYRGSFYACRGGWFRQGKGYYEKRGGYLGYSSEPPSDSSLIFVFNKDEKESSEI